jgi:outer membrane protein assembly factor BamB
MPRSIGRAPFLLFTFLAAGLIVAGCDPDRLVDATGDLSFAEPKLDLGQTWVGGAFEAEATLRNGGRSSLDVSWQSEGAPWEFEHLPAVAESGETRIRMRLPATAPGTHRATLTARSGDAHAATLELVATVIEVPECPQPLSCAALVFDLTRGACVETPLEDGTPCDAGSVCVTEATCQAGRCVGVTRSCDDGNACTVDSCNPLTGCESTPAPPCPGDGKCQVGVCDPQSGCGLAPAVDGSSCGSVSCDAAQVCISGACVVRDPPDGYICAEPSPCQGAGMCQGSSCVRPPQTSLKSSWSWDSFGDGTAPKDLHDFVLERDGDMALMGFFSQPIVNANSLSPLELPATARRCIGWNGQLACADYREGGGDGRVALIDTNTGSTSWLFNLKTARPDLNAASDALFLARVASLGSDRLAAIYESYPKDSGDFTQLRRYYLVILDAAGGMVSAQKIDDPLLEAENHPHPYGVVSDITGNLYVSFSPTLNDGAPLLPDQPALFLSYTRDGVLRWKRQYTQTGGELAVARGKVFPENSQFPLDAATGQALIPSRNEPMEELGRIVATSSHYVTSPEPWRRNQLRAYTYDGAAAWRYTLPSGDFSTSEIRAVQWTPQRPGASSELAVLAFAQDANQRSLVAVRAHDGQELWSCPVAMSLPAQLFETTIDGLAVMSSATTCGECDPPFADSSALFSYFEVPGFSPAPVPWPGTFGGSDHDHLENPVWGVPAN